MSATVNDDFFKAAAALMQCSSDPGQATVAHQRALESALGNAAREFLSNATKAQAEVRLNALKGDFGRASAALMQCSSDPGAKPHLEAEFAKAAYNLMQCSSDPGGSKVSPEFKRAAVALMQGAADPKLGQAKKKQLATDFSKVAAALLQCSSGG